MGTKLLVAHRKRRGNCVFLYYRMCSLVIECVLLLHFCGAQEVEGKLRKHELTKLEGSIKELTGHSAKLNH